MQFARRMALDQVQQAVSCWCWCVVV
jgi:hypothetical protein